ncbi:hypothetical protein L1887_60848 [Cichorium endivia]|nr:hypothetical protein L1887_60848 [Cichorium endivia]
MGGHLRLRPHPRAQPGCHRRRSRPLRPVLADRQQVRIQMHHPRHRKAPLARQLPSLDPPHKGTLGTRRVDSQASWPSLLDNQSRLEPEERACAAVFDYLANVPTFAQVLPIGANTPNAPFETMEGGDYTSVTYRITRLMRVPGTPNSPRARHHGFHHIRARKGSRDRALESPPGPSSAWKLMRDVLSSFPPAYADHSAADHDADPFREGRQAVDLAQLAPADAHVPWEELASDVLDLFASIISSSADLAWAVLAHLDGRATSMQTSSRSTWSPRSSNRSKRRRRVWRTQKSLSSIAVSLLSHALVAAPISVRLVRSTLKLLTVLLPYDPDAVWQEVRSSNALIGSPGAIPYLSKVTSSASASTVSALLTQELGRASYSGLISLLDFHIACSQSSRDRTRPPRSKCSRRRPTFSFELSAGSSNASGPSTRAGGTFALQTGSRSAPNARACSRWRSQNEAGVLLSPLPPDSADGAGPASSLVEMAERNLVTHPSILGLAPLITCIGTGQQLLEALGRAGRQTDAVLAEEWIASTLRLATLIVSRRREHTLAALHDLSSLPAETAKKAMSARLNTGLFERLFFDHTIVASRAVLSGARKSNRVELAGAAFAYVLFPTSTVISSSAAHLITAILRSTADLAPAGKQPPGLIGHLGTLAELEDTLSGLVELVNNPNQDATLKVRVWTMLAAIVDTQPALGTLLLTGRHLAMTTETRLNTSEANTKADKPETKATDTAHSFTRGKALTTTALDVASEAILSWRPTHREGPHLLEAVLRFLDVAWIHAAEHVAAFDTIRTNVSFFRALADIVCETTQVPSTVAQDLEDADSALHSRSDDSVATYCYQKMCQARSLRLLQHDIQLGGILKNSSKNDKPSKASLDAMLDMLTSSDRILGALETCFSMPCDPQMRASLERKLVELFPSIYVDQLRHPRRKDDFDLDRRYGDDYHFNTASFRAKAEGRILDHESAGEVALIEEGLLAIQTINMEWSLIDVQNSVLQAWTQCVELCMGRIVAQALGQSKMSGMEKDDHHCVDGDLQRWQPMRAGKATLCAACMRCAWRC